MTQRAELLKEIDELPPEYLGEVIDFAAYLRQKARLEASPTSLAGGGGEAKDAPESADGGVTSPVDALVGILSKDVDGGTSPHPHSDALLGILKGMGDIDPDDMRMERIVSKHLKHLK